MPKELIHLGFMTAREDEISSSVETIGRTVSLLQAKEATRGIATRVMLVLSGKAASIQLPDEFNEIPYMEREIVRIEPRRTASGERHRLFGAGFIEGASFVTICDLDYGHKAEAIAETIYCGILNHASVVIPQGQAEKDTSEPWVIDKFSTTFEDYLLDRVACQNPRSGEKRIRTFQNGLWFFESRAVRELLKRPWILECVLWDVEAAFLVLAATENWRIEFPRVDLGRTRPQFAPKEAILKIQVLGRLSGRLGRLVMQEYFEDFCHRFSHKIKADIADFYRREVLQKL